MDIHIEEWTYCCDDGCCYESGAYLTLDGKTVPHSFYNTEDALEYVLSDILGHKVHKE